MNKKNYFTWMGIGALIAGLYVALGAFGAHGLKAHLDASSLAIYHTGLRYLIIHALALIMINFIGLQLQRSYLAVNVLISIGMLLFSVSLLIHACKSVLGIEMDLFAMLAPFGGLSYLAAWIVLAYQFIKK